jgi:Mg2+ and Co2+ transporter CorA
MNEEHLIRDADHVLMVERPERGFQELLVMKAGQEKDISQLEKSKKKDAEVESTFDGDMEERLQLKKDIEQRVALLRAKEVLLTGFESRFDEKKRTEYRSDILRGNRHLEEEIVRLSEKINALQEKHDRLLPEADARDKKAKV